MISVFGCDVGENEKEAVGKTLDSQWLGLGKVVEQFETNFSKYINGNNFLMLDSGSNALFLALKLLNLPAGKEVILPSFTWVSCAQAVLLNGLKPVFCDVEIDTMNCSLETITPHISADTGAIMVVHYAGLPVQMDPIIALGYPVVEDAAHAVSSTHNGSSCGTLGDVGIYSFDSVKNLAVGEGGGISIRTREMYERARKLRYCGIGKSGFEASESQNNAGIWWEYDISEPFIKMLPNNVAASIGVAQLERIAELQAKRKSIWEFYSTHLNEEKFILPLDAQPGDQHSYFTYCIRTERRNELARYLKSIGIYTTLRYHPLHLNSLYKSNLKLTNSEVLNSDALSIPLHPRMTEEQVTYVVKHLNEFGA